MLSNPGFVIRFAPLLASLALIFSCCYLYDIPSPTAVPVPSATPECHMHFTNPADGAALPASGLVTFSWSSVTRATNYILSVSGPGNGGKVSYPTSNTSWPVDVSALGGDGTYSAAVQSRDSDSNILCQAQITFKRVSATATPTPTRTSAPTSTRTKAVKPHKAPVATGTPTLPAPTPTKRRPTRTPTRTPIILK